MEVIRRNGLSWLNLSRDKIKNGKFIKKSKSGNILCIAYFKNYEINGEYLEYWNNGIRRVEYNYKKGKLHGECKLYNKLGNKVWGSYFNKGVKISKEEWDKKEKLKMILNKN